MSKRPAGTVTLLFTSGVLFWAELVDRYLGGVDREVDSGLPFEEAVQFGLDVAADRPALVGMDS
jgi:hypothetical protein